MNWPYYLNKYLYLILFLLFAIFSCGKDNHIRTYRLPKKAIEISASATSNSDDEFKLKWKKPESWIEFDGHSMRLASFYVPYSKGKGELSITNFVGMSGSIEANINRWRGQISLAPESIENIMAMSKSYNGRMGNFLFFELENKNINQAILASIFQLENRTVFIKLLIDQSGLDEVTLEYLRFSQSLSKYKE